MNEWPEFRAESLEAFLWLRMRITEPLKSGLLSPTVDVTKRRRRRSDSSECAPKRISIKVLGAVLLSLVCALLAK